MAIVKKLLVKTPVTQDGKSILRDENNNDQISESIVEPAARKHLESINATKENGLKSTFEEVDYDDVRHRIVRVEDKISTDPDGDEDDNSKTADAADAEAKKNALKDALIGVEAKIGQLEAKEKLTDAQHRTLAELHAKRNELQARME